MPVWGLLEEPLVHLHLRGQRTGLGSVPHLQLGPGTLALSDTTLSAPQRGPRAPELPPRGHEAQTSAESPPRALWAWTQEPDAAVRTCPPSRGGGQAVTWGQPPCSPATQPPGSQGRGHPKEGPQEGHTPLPEAGSYAAWRPRPPGISGSSQPPGPCLPGEHSSASWLKAPKTEVYSSRADRQHRGTETALTSLGRLLLEKTRRGQHRCRWPEHQLRMFSHSTVRAGAGPSSRCSRTSCFWARTAVLSSIRSS